jgi:hypothetical protein
MESPVKVFDATSGRLKRWETSEGKPIAIVLEGKLTLTELGKGLGYRVNGQAVEQE